MENCTAPVVSVEPLDIALTTSPAVSFIVAETDFVPAPVVDDAAIIFV